MNPEMNIDKLVAYLLRQSHVLPADHLADGIAAGAQQWGFRELVIYLADHEQTNLVPLPVSDQKAEPFPIDGTAGGRAYVTGEVVATEAADGSRLWVSLLDGGERLGTMAVTVAADTDQARQDAEELASLVALLVLSKNQYTDVQEVCRRSREVDLAAEVQLALLPPLTYTNSRIAIAGFLENAYDTGGDAFDYAVNGPVAHLAVFDAMGHGLEASLSAATVMAAYRNGRRKGMSLVELFSALDATVAAQPGSWQFVTAQLGELEIETGHISWINGGHPRPFHVRQGRVVGQLACRPTPPLGLSLPITEVASTRLEPGDRLLFFSDGVVEAKSLDGQPFGEDRLADVLGQVSLAQTRPAETMRRLGQAVMRHQGSHLVDDASMLLLEWVGPAE